MITNSQRSLFILTNIINVFLNCECIRPNPFPLCWLFLLGKIWQLKSHLRVVETECWIWKGWLSWAGGGKINGHQHGGKSSLWVSRTLVGETFPQWKREHTLRPSIHPTTRHPVEHVWVPCINFLLEIYISFQEWLNQDQLITHSIINFNYRDTCF